MSAPSVPCAGRGVLPTLQPFPEAAACAAVQQRPCVSCIGYAADGFARARGIGCVVVTFTVGGLSVINAVAGAMSEHLPLICITGEGRVCSGSAAARALQHPQQRRGLPRSGHTLCIVMLV